MCQNTKKVLFISVPLNIEGKEAVKTRVKRGGWPLILVLIVPGRILAFPDSHNLKITQLVTNALQYLVWVSALVRTPCTI